MGTVLEHVGDVAVVAWALGEATGPTARDVNGPRLERMLERLVDTPVRGFVLDAPPDGAGGGRPGGDGHTDLAAAVTRGRGAALQRRRMGRRDAGRGQRPDLSGASEPGYCSVERGKSIGGRGLLLGVGPRRRLDLSLGGSLVELVREDDPAEDECGDHRERSAVDGELLRR